MKYPDHSVESVLAELGKPFGLTVDGGGMSQASVRPFDPRRPASN
jgi:hypothetical protein